MKQTSDRPGLDFRAYFRLLPGILYCLGLVLTSPAWATNCGAIPNGTLSTQDQVTNFQQYYGPCDTIVANLEIESADISDLTSLGDLTTIGGVLSLYYTTSLPSLGGLQGLTSLGGLGIEGANALTSLAGLQNLTAIGSLFIMNNELLPNLNGLPSTLAGVENLVVFGNPSMTSLSGLPVIGALTGILNIGDNLLLNSMAALGSSQIPVGVQPQIAFTISGNPMLTSLAGLPSVDKLWGLGVSENALLSSLAGLEGLVEVWEGISVYDNPVLSDCSVLATVLDDVDDGDAGPTFDPAYPPDGPGEDPFLSGNLNGCNSIEQILVVDPDDLILEDGFEDA